MSWLRRLLAAALLVFCVAGFGFGLGFAQQPDLNAPLDPSMETPSADASGAEDMMLAPRDALYLETSALWDDNFDTLRDSFRALADEAKALGLETTGHPLAVYLDTTDDGFKFQAMLPLAMSPDATKTPSQARFKFGKTPEGRALRFPSVGAFDEIDSLYEAIAGYLDEKALTMRTPYIEEYLSGLTNSTDPETRMNIYVLLDDNPATSGTHAPRALKPAEEAEQLAPPPAPQAPEAR
jgi:effector-binding domain-containing protein